jgi:hypothetical protein
LTYLSLRFLESGHLASESVDSSVIAPCAIQILRKGRLERLDGVLQNSLKFDICLISPFDSSRQHRGKHRTDDLASDHARKLPTNVPVIVQYRLMVRKGVANLL